MLPAVASYFFVHAFGRLGREDRPAEIAAQFLQIVHQGPQRCLASPAAPARPAGPSRRPCRLHTSGRDRPVAVIHAAPQSSRRRCKRQPRCGRGLCPAFLRIFTVPDRTDAVSALPCRRRRSGRILHRRKANPPCLRSPPRSSRSSRQRASSAAAGSWCSCRPPQSTGRHRTRSPCGSSRSRPPRSSFASTRRRISSSLSMSSSMIVGFVGMMIPATAARENGHARGKQPKNLRVVCRSRGPFRADPP